jgi:hypothetical protein
MQMTFDPELPLGQGPAQETTLQKFIAFHNAHPEVFSAIYQAACDSYNSRRISMRRIAEDLRGQFGALRINNNFLPYYTDLVIEASPAFRTKFERRFRIGIKTKKIPAQR